MSAETEHPAYGSHAGCLSVLLHLRKRLRDEYGVDVTPEWEMRVIGGEHDIPLPFSIDERLGYVNHVLSKAWSILADGQRALDPDADPEYDTNNMYDLVREGAEARKRLADGKREIEKFIANRTEEALVEFDVTLKAVSDAVESCAKIADKYEDEACCHGGCGRNIAELIRGGK